MTDPNTFGAPNPQPYGRPSDSSRSMAMLAHLSALLAALTTFALLGPLIMWLVFKDSDDYVGREALEALNFNLFAFMVMVVGGVVTVITSLLIFGLLFIPVLALAGVAWFVFVIVGAVRAYSGEGYRYPVTWRIIK